MKKILYFIQRILNHVLIRLYRDTTVANFYRRKQGVEIGEGCRILDRRLNLFGSEPYLIRLGKSVTLTEGVQLITHDGGVCIFRKDFPGLNMYGRIEIKDNCFIGVNSIILPGVTIGPNSIIGAGSVVTKDIPANVVAAGVPAKNMKRIDEYKNKAMKEGTYVNETNYSDLKTKLLKSVRM